jgi:hypothetical protein
VFRKLPLTKQEVDTQVAVRATDDGDDCDCMSLGIGTGTAVPQAPSLHGITMAAPPAEPTVTHELAVHDTSESCDEAAPLIAGRAVAVGSLPVSGKMKPWLLAELSSK